MTTVAETMITSNGTHPSSPSAIFPELAPTLGEAPCSVNVRFKVEGYLDPVQATGRGRTAEEAAQNLAATIQATRKALAPTVEAKVDAPKVTLGTLVESLMCKATDRQDWGAVERIAKASALVLSGAVQPGDRDGLYCVRSQKPGDEGVWYSAEVAYQDCSCPDQQKRLKAQQPGFCKHLIAICLHNRLTA